MECILCVKNSNQRSGVNDGTPFHVNFPSKWLCDFLKGRIGHCQICQTHANPVPMASFYEHVQSPIFQ